MNHGLYRISHSEDYLQRYLLGLVDGEHDQEELLKFISKPSPAKWIVSSRNWSEIEDMLNDAEQKVKIHLEIKQDSISAAVQSYIKLKVDQIVQKKNYDDSMKMAILEYLTANSSGTFLWVALVCRKLVNPWGRKRSILETLKSFPLGLDLLYQRMLRYIFESDDAQRFKDILAQVLAVYRPITLEELHVLVGGLEDLAKEEADELIASCGSFLTLHNNVVSFVHQSAKDYLLESAIGDILPFEAP
ncbi:Vegetative incompatibility protein HET-E-1 [Ceratocystis lukuohia]|uniref:Vegetative incompatibility protein HET-E-1 n=1 Tax=Ceratocystis lukuohia TaxID=2019550 RepID=A0ABR4M995_9PEZI